MHVLLISFKSFNFDSERIVISDWIRVIVNENHIFFLSENFFQVSEILDHVSVDFFAAVTIKSLLNDSMNIDLVEYLISVFFLSCSVHINCENFTTWEKEIMSKGSWLDVHCFVITLKNINWNIYCRWNVVWMIRLCRSTCINESFVHVENKDKLFLLCFFSNI